MPLLGRMTKSFLSLLNLPVPYLCSWDPFLGCCWSMEERKRQASAGINNLKVFSNPNASMILSLLVHQPKLQP